ncbi:hypothetical protein Agub_g13770, partial [Astrephomene gubernaculifera]
TGDIGIMAGIRLLRGASTPPEDDGLDNSDLGTSDTPLHSGIDIVELRCPEVFDSATGFSMPDPTCNLPFKRLARGEDAVALKEDNRLLSGDSIKITVDVTADVSSATTTADPGSSRRRLLAASAKFRKRSLRVIKKGAQKECYTGTPIEPRMVVYLLDMCGWSSP